MIKRSIVVALGIILLAFGATAEPEHQQANGFEPARLMGAGRVTGMAWSADGERLAVASTRGVWLYNRRNLGAQPVLIEQDNSQINHVAFSPEGDELGVADEAAGLMRWSLITGDKYPLPIPAGARAPRQRNSGVIAYSPDGRWLAYGSVDVILLDRLTGDVSVLPCAYTIQDIQFSADSRYLACFTSAPSVDSGAVAICDLADEPACLLPRGYMPGMSSGAFSPDGTRVYGLSEFNAAHSPVLAWSLNDNARISDETLLAEGLTRIASILYSADGRVVVISAVYDEGLSALEIRRDDRLILEQRIRPQEHALSADGRAYAYYVDDTLYVVDTETGIVSLVSTDHHSGYRVIAISPDDRYAAVAGGASVYLWDLTTGEYVRRLPLQDAITRLAFSDDGRLAAMNPDGVVYVWSPASAGLTRFAPPMPALHGDVRGLAGYFDLAWNGDFFVVLGCRESLGHRAETHHVSFASQISGGVFYALPVECSPFRDDLLLLNANGSVALYSPWQGNRGSVQVLTDILTDAPVVVAEVPLTDQALFALALSDDASRLTIGEGSYTLGGGARDTLLYQWQLDTSPPTRLILLIDCFFGCEMPDAIDGWQPLLTDQAPLEIINTIVYAPSDSAVFAVGGGDFGGTNSLQVWRVAPDGRSGALLHQASDLQHAVEALGFTHDGMHIISTGGRNGILRVWQVGIE